MWSNRASDKLPILNCNETVWVSILLTCPRNYYYPNVLVRCKILDKHLNILAKKHLETKFCKIDAEKCPFLCDRLKIKVWKSTMENEIICWFLVNLNFFFYNFNWSSFCLGYTNSDSNQGK